MISLPVIVIIQATKPVWFSSLIAFRRKQDVTKRGMDARRETMLAKRRMFLT